MILDSPNYFVREKISTFRQTKKGVVSFAALVTLYKIGFPAESIREAGGVIMESTLVQAISDSAEIIKEYDRETVASLGMIDGNLFLNQVDDTGKEYWLKEAGSFKKYCEAIPVITNDNDLLEGIFGGHDIKDVFGICDYDAISFIHHNEEYSLIAVEAILSSLSIDEELKLNVISIPDWLVIQKISGERLLGYTKSLLDKGCLISVTKNVIDYLPLEISKADEGTKKKLYLLWDRLLSDVGKYPEKQRIVFIQAISEVIASYKDEIKSVDAGILRILINNILLLRKQKIEMIFDGEQLSFALVNAESEEQIVEIKQK